MARLEDLTKGAQVKGVRLEGPVAVHDARWHGTNTLELVQPLPHQIPAVSQEMVPELTRLAMASQAGAAGSGQRDLHGDKEGA